MVGMYDMNIVNEELKMPPQSKFKLLTSIKIVYWHTIHLFDIHYIPSFIHTHFFMLLLSCSFFYRTYIYSLLHASTYTYVLMIIFWIPLQAWCLINPFFYDSIFSFIWIIYLYTLYKMWKFFLFDDVIDVFLVISMKGWNTFLQLYIVYLKVFKVLWSQNQKWVQIFDYIVISYT